MQPQLGLSCSYDEAIECRRLLSDTGWWQTAQSIAHLRHRTLTQDEHGALRAEVVELHTLEEGRSARIGSEGGRSGGRSGRRH